MPSHSVQDNPYNNNISMARVYMVLFLLTSVTHCLLMLHHLWQFPLMYKPFNQRPVR